MGSSEGFSATLNDQFLTADTALLSGGRTPSVHLHCQSGGKLDWDALIPHPGTGHMRVVGATNGTFGLVATLTEAGPTTSDTTDWCWHPARVNLASKGRV